jgi:hypothetical protein
MRVGCRTQMSPQLPVTQVEQTSIAENSSRRWAHAIFSVQIECKHMERNKRRKVYSTEYNRHVFQMRYALFFVCHGPWCSFIASTKLITLHITMHTMECLSFNMNSMDNLHIRHSSYNISPGSYFVSSDFFCFLRKKTPYILILVHTPQY